MATKYEMSKTYQYRKVMKPLLERKRRARINKCLDDLKDLMAESLQQESGDPNFKLERADILELTVEHLRHIKIQNQQQQQQQRQPRKNRQETSLNSSKSFRSGYIHAANEVSRCLAALPNVDIHFGTKLMTHLGLRLNQLEAVEDERSSIGIHTPLRINCQNTQSSFITVAPPTLYSPVSSGYASDSDYSRCSNSPMSIQMLTPTAASTPIASQQHAKAQNLGLLQITQTVWRPW